MAKAAGVVSAATLLSRVFGLVRDLVTAYFFGAGVGADAFFVAFRLPNLMRRLLAEGALTVAFIPVFSDYLENKGREEAYHLARTALTLLTLVLVGVSLAGVLGAPWLVRVFAPGFQDDPALFELTVRLTRIVFPYIFFVALVALAMGILNSLGVFAAPALSPVMLNLAMIAAVVLFAGRVDPPALALAWGVIAGGALQVLLQVPDLLRRPGLLGLGLDFRHPALKRIMILMGPAALGAAVYQFSVFINTILASFLPQGSVSYLYYADRVMQFPLGVFAIAVATAVLPSLSRQAAVRDTAGLSDTMAFSLQLVFFITIPATFGLIVLSRPIVSVLFQRGRFGPEDAHAAAAALIAYVLGLAALSAVQILVRVFYALKDTRTPVKVGVISLLFNVAVAVTLMGPLKHVGLALGGTFGAALNCALLVVYLRRKLGPLGGRAVALSAARNTVWAAAMTAVVWSIRTGLAAWLPATRWRDLLTVVVGIAAGFSVYWALAYWRGAPEARTLTDAISRRFRRGGT